MKILSQHKGAFLKLAMGKFPSHGFSFSGGLKMKIVYKSFEKMNEISVNCRPTDYGGKYPFWINIPYTDGEHRPPHAHLWKGSNLKTAILIGKFEITKETPKNKNDVKILKDFSGMNKYKDAICNWANEYIEDNDFNDIRLTNWQQLKLDWVSFEKTLKSR